METALRIPTPHRARVAFVVATAALLVGCGARGGLDLGVGDDGTRPVRDAGPGRRDAGPAPDAGRRDAGPPGLACDDRFICRGVPHTTGTSELELFPGVGVGNVAVGPSLHFGDNIVVGWGARTCCTDRLLSASGIVVIRPTIVESVLVFSAIDVEAPSGRISPIALLSPEGVLLVDRRAPPFDGEARFFRMDGSLEVAPDLPLEGGLSQSEPASATSERGSAILQVNPTVRLRGFGPDITPQWDVELAGEAHENAVVVQTCQGYVALFRTRRRDETIVAAVSFDGRLLAPPRSLGAEHVRAATWDGRSVVVSTSALRGGEGALFELSPSGDVLTLTPLDGIPEAAFGVESGLAVLMTGPGGAGTELSIVERGTGRVITMLSALGGVTNDAEVLLGEVRGALVRTSFSRRDEIILHGIECAP